MVTTENWRKLFHDRPGFRFAVVLLAISVMAAGGMMFPAGACCRSTGSYAPKGEFNWTPAVSDLEPDPGVVAGILPNGFRYVMLQNREPKDRVSMHLLVQAGSLHEAEAELGIAHFLEHMMFNGSENFQPGVYASLSSR